ncbi:MAG TPA: hypothetical protein VFU73_08095, partial [Actinocrinis sp.]|nr:hypothetical protein [Actinocrinis sp.]
MATATLENMAPPVSALGRLPDWGVRREGSAGREISMGLIGTHQARDDLEGRCGFFERRRKWTVDPPEAGVIIQLITRSFDVSEWTGSSWRKMSGAEIDAYATTRRSAPYATVLQYWELWEVSSSGGVSDGNEDTFSLCAIIPPTATTDHQMRNTTRGSFVITGHARFYAYGRGRVTPESLGFTR